jgi:CHAT domain-containing protein/Tfp pilus assembly protein PilF
MRRAREWMAVFALCCAATALAGEPPPGARLQEAQKAYDEAKTLDEAGKYAEAMARGEQALALREAVLGGTHPEVANCLNLLGRLHWRQGDLEGATQLVQRGLTIREEALGATHPDVASSLNSLALLYSNQGKYAQAEPLYQRALAIREGALGKNHPDVASSLHNLAALYHEQGLYDRAQPLYERVLALREETLGKNHLRVASSLNNLALLYLEQGLYDRAGSLHQRALTIREAALGKNHPDVAQSLNNLAIVYSRQGLYGRAGPLLERALAIWEAALGKNHPDVADSLHNLAHLYEKQGMFDRAEPLYQRAIAIQEAALGKNHPHVADSLHNLANLYVGQGMYDRAESLFQRARAIKEEAFGKNNPQVASTLGDLASLYWMQGLYDRAEPLYQRAIAIQEAALGKSHPDLAISLHNLANLYVDQGLYGQAQPLYQRALAIQEATLGKNHPHVADSLNSLALLYWKQGMYSRAEPLYQRALAIREATLDKNHPYIADSLNNLAALGLARHRLDAALPLFMRAFAASEQRLRQEALGFSEARLDNLLQLLRAEEERLYALLRQHPDNAQVRRLALSAALLLKGRSVEETADISRAVYRSLGAEERDTFERLRGLRTQLAELSFQGPGSLTPAAHQRQLAELAERGDVLEAELARRSAPLRARAALPSPADIVDRVAHALPEDGALVEFITYVDRPLMPGPGTPEPRQHYLALVLFPDATTRALDLGAAEPIDSAASRLRVALANRDAGFQAQAQALYRLAFQPLLPLLGKTRRLFLSPDGQLSLVPFDALHDGHHFLMDAFDFTSLTSGKDLLPRPQETVPAASVIVLADPDFGAPLPPSVAQADASSVPAGHSTSVEPFASLLREDPVYRAWHPVPLPGTRREAEAIQRLIPQARLFLGAEATRQRLLHLDTPGILHLATHGFFLEDAPTPKGTRGVVHFKALGEDSTTPRPPEPLLRSGLLLAGASAPAPSNPGVGPPSSDNALITALELAGLDLWGTQLVVLSACDTGRGDIRMGQGVYGLRRAFLVAGAETVVTSLWKVDDETTSTLMEAYYRNLLAGRGRSTALREAMRALRETRPHPHYWAPFIALGQDTPLQGVTPDAPSVSPR